jgi:hypothetical protein
MLKFESKHVNFKVIKLYMYCVNNVILLGKLL